MSKTPTIADHLADRFDSKRIVVWHDPDGGYAAALDALALSDVTVLRIADDEFAVKHRVLREEPTAKFLIYRSGSVPEGVGNWLLDIELAYGPVFTADRDALMRVDLELTAPGSDELIARYQSFFNDAKLVARLKSLPLRGSDLTVAQAQMCAVLLNQKEHSFSELTRTLLMQHADGDTTGFDALSAHGPRGLLLGRSLRLLRVHLADADDGWVRAMDVSARRRRVRSRRVEEGTKPGARLPRFP
ncbi:hypothetical protein G9444_0046 [Rhodococcus erythropolis]|uniref:BREX-1 system phosphatase PglZ type A n=1 Tax=Rhodococcus erythropolis TaxID=1833 RepID=A0A6G9CKE7_RHOER|nr:hypothetical protein G9444_0046 [Rhodococcus erythropolis]